MTDWYVLDKSARTITGPTDQATAEAARDATHAINTDLGYLQDVKNQLDDAAGGGGGSGSGLVVGAWTEIDFSDVPTFPATDPYVLAALDVPSEVEVVYVPNPSESGAFTIESADDPGVVVYASSITSWDIVTYSYPFRTIVPPGVPVQVRALFGGGGWTVQNIRRRTLG